MPEDAPADDVRPASDVTPSPDVTTLLERLGSVVAEARAVPMSASCVVNRVELLDLVGQLRERLPLELQRASVVLQDREAVLADGRREVEAMLQAAREECAGMVRQAAVVREAQEEATRLLAEAREASETMRLEVEDYCDAKLANFEIVLTKTLAAVERGRRKLGGHSELEQLAGDPGLGEPRS